MSSEYGHDKLLQALQEVHSLMFVLTDAISAAAQNAIAIENGEIVTGICPKMALHIENIAHIAEGVAARAIDAALDTDARQTPAPRKLADKSLRSATPLQS